MKILKAVAIFLLFTNSNLALANVGFLNNIKIQGLLARENEFGSCMIKINESISDLGLNCTNGWVSFSCDGTFNKNQGKKMFELSQMAFALELPIFLEIHDTAKHNGYCVAVRIDIYK